MFECIQSIECNSMTNHRNSFIYFIAHICGLDLSGKLIRDNPIKTSLKNEVYQTSLINIIVQNLQVMSRERFLSMNSVPR